MSIKTLSNNVKIFSGNSNSLLNYCSTEEKLFELTQSVKDEIKNTIVLYTKHIEDKYFGTRPTKRKKHCYVEYLKLFVNHVDYQHQLPLTRMWLFAALDIPKAVSTISYDKFKDFVDELFRRVDKCKKTHGDAVGIEAAQSCSERFTQSALNSVDWNTQMVIRWTGTSPAPVSCDLKVGAFIDALIEERKNDIQIQPDGVTVYLPLKRGEAEALSPDEDGNMMWTSLEAVTRHPPINKDGSNTMINVTIESGHSVTVTKGKSLLIERNGKLVQVDGDSVKIGDKIPVVQSLPEFTNNTLFDLATVFKKSEYVFTDELIAATIVWDEYRWFSKGNWKERVPYSRSDSLRDAVLRKRTYLIDHPGMVTLKDGSLRKSDKKETLLPQKITLDRDFGFFIGAYLAEGCVSKFQVVIANNDLDYVNACKEWPSRLGITSHYKVRHINNGTSSSLRFPCRLLVNLLHTICGKFSAGKRVPFFAFGAPDEFIKGLLDAYFSGDGTVSKKRVCIVASSRSMALRDGISLLLARFGIQTSLGEQLIHSKINWTTEDGGKRTQEKYGEKTPNYILSTNTIGAIRFAETLTLTIGYKQRRLDEYKKHKPRIKNCSIYQGMNDVFLQPIVSIEEVPSSHPMVYDLTVEKTRNMVLHSGIATADTFHSAGAKKSALVGITRIKEVLDAYKKLNLPVIGPIDVDCDIKELYGKTLADYCSETAVVYEPTLSNNKRSNFLLYFKLKDPKDWNVIRESHYIPKKTKDEMFFKDGVIYMLLHKKSVIDPPKLVLEYKHGKVPIYEHIPHQVYSVLNLEANRHVSGLKDCVDYDEEDKLLFFNPKTNLAQCTKSPFPGKPDTYKSNVDLDELTRICPNLDLTKLVSNDIYWIYTTLGISAVESYLTKEINSVLGAEGININIQHINLIAANMTHTGEIRANKYSGLKNNNSVFRKATFQQGTETFAKAAARSAVDKISDVSSQILMGKIATIGTQYSYLVSDVVEHETIVERPQSPEYAPVQDSSEYAPSSPIEYAPASPKYMPSSPISYCPASPIATKTFETDIMIEPEIHI